MDSVKLIFEKKKYIFVFACKIQYEGYRYYLCFSTSAIKHRHHPLALLLAGLVGKAHQSFFYYSFTLLRNSDPIPDPDFFPLPVPGSRIPDRNNKKEDEKKNNNLSCIICSYKFL
jgi:hypothetical protein